MVIDGVALTHHLPASVDRLLLPCVSTIMHKLGQVSCLQIAPRPLFIDSTAFYRRIALFFPIVLGRASCAHFARRTSFIDALLVTDMIRLSMSGLTRELISRQSPFIAALPSFPSSTRRPVRQACEHNSLIDGSSSTPSHTALPSFLPLIDPPASAASM